MGRPPPGAGPSFINTYQRGAQESVWETIPQPTTDPFKYGGPNGCLDLLVGDRNYAKQWKYTNAPDADARAVQAAAAPKTGAERYPEVGFTGAAPPVRGPTTAWRSVSAAARRHREPPPGRSSCGWTRPTGPTSTRPTTTAVEPIRPTPTLRESPSMRAALSPGAPLPDRVSPSPSVWAVTGRGPGEGRARDTPGTIRPLSLSRQGAAGVSQAG
ncbi:hypothetical protein GCM10010207_59850 [Streptomyces atratus]|nr:hypothetical protein GCM10010207_59850 [Streptomyces atratus]